METGKKKKIFSKASLEKNKRPEGSSFPWTSLDCPAERLTRSCCISFLLDHSSQALPSQVPEQQVGCSSTDQIASRAAWPARAVVLQQLCRLGLRCSMRSLSEPRQHFPYPDSQPGPRLNVRSIPRGQHEFGRCSASLVCQTLVKTLLASAWCCLPLGRHHTTAATQERAEQEQWFPTSPPRPQALFSSGNDGNKYEEYNKQMKDRPGWWASRGLGRVWEITHWVFPNPATSPDSKHRAPSLPAAELRLDCSEERIRLLKWQMRGANPAFCWCPLQPAGHLSMNFTSGFKLRRAFLTETESKPQVLRVDRNFKHIIPVSGNLQQFPHSCPCLLELPPPKQPHPEMAAVPGSVLPQHSLYFEEAGCKLYSHFLFSSFFLSFLSVPSDPKPRDTYSPGMKNIKLCCKQTRSLLDSNSNDASCASVQQTTGGHNLLYFSSCDINNVQIP